MKELFDIHSHIGEQRHNLFGENNLYPRRQELEVLIDKYKERIDKIVAFPMPGTVYFNYDSPNPKKSGISKHPFELENRALIEAVDASGRGDKIVPFACVHPRECVTEQLNQLSELMRNKRLCGIKFHTLDTDSSIDDFFSNTEIVDFCKHYKMPIMIHSGNFEGVENCNGIFDWADKYPELNICLAHLMTFSKDFFEGLEKYKGGNVFTDTSPFLALCAYMSKTGKENMNTTALDLIYDNPLLVLQSLYKKFPSSLIWGSDEPFDNFEIDKGESISYSLDDEINFLMSINGLMRNVMAGDNSRRFLGEKAK